MKNVIIIGMLCFIFATSCSKKKKSKMPENIPTPIAKIIPKILEKHDDQRTDN
jgi:oligopeptidase B